MDARGLWDFAKAETTAAWRAMIDAQDRGDRRGEENARAYHRACCQDESQARPDYYVAVDHDRAGFED